jgi:hypothetical protein
MGKGGGRRLCTGAFDRFDLFLRVTPLWMARLSHDGFRHPRWRCASTRCYTFPVESPQYLIDGRIDTVLAVWSLGKRRHTVVSRITSALALAFPGGW